MSKRKRAERRTGRTGGSARMPSQVPAERSNGGSARWSARGTAGDWLLLPGGTWRRVETIRVESLFG
ncbi:hypothetical protein [Streptomyces sp. NBC_01571]|uniref:hypothetical protein n=1 Tax=unclassified Streptomyces TaxID=2593676 RepID=UPI002259375C|nr:hypothetical protein [Streptomyces sp. NBC_01571]MCX4572676.1 hypothetical protein [Streptomyces sp. NBC_01571]